MKERGVKPKDWKEWIKDNKQRRRKCDKYFPTINVEEGKAKFKEIVEKFIRSGYYGYNIIVVIILYSFEFPTKSFENQLTNIIMRFLSTFSFKHSKVFWITSMASSPQQMK